MNDGELGSDNNTGIPEDISVPLDNSISAYRTNPFLMESAFPYNNQTN